MTFVLIQFLNGLASASSLFLIASGLSIIFGVTRIINFAHGSFYMMGAYIAFSFITWLPRTPLGFWGGIVLGALAVAVLGALVEIVLLKRIYRSPELFQLLATFGVVLVVADAALKIWGAEELLAPRPPGLRGAVDIMDRAFPQYDLFLMAIGPVVLAALWLLFRRTRWGALVRAATQDRDMVSALGVNERWLFTAVFFLGSFLAGLGGALQLPRQAANLQMDITTIVEAFVVVVVGGLGSIEGAYIASVLVAVVQAFGIVVVPKASLVLIFLVMAIVLVIRPHGLFGRPIAEGQAEAVHRRFSLPRNSWRYGLPLLALLVFLPLVASGYTLTVMTEIMILALFAASLHFIMGPGGMASFGHAAFFGLGAYAAALAAHDASVPMLVGIALAPIAASLLAIACGWFCVRLSGVYLAMLTLAVAQIVWSVAFQWTDLTGGDNGVLGVWPPSWARNGGVFYLLALALSAGAIWWMRRIIFAPFGYALRAGRDAPLRAEATGIDLMRVRWVAFAIAAAFAGLAGGLFAYAKGSVFPTYIAVSRSVDALLMVLLGGIHTITGPLVGALLYVGLQEQISRLTDLWRLVLGLTIIGLVLAFPEGVVGFALRWRRAPEAAP
ncbi:MAG TPA: ABC transporter permease [Stellaceae bacterium]|nr:ABC transporter permease [Stellaceae bacterium]